MSRHAPTCPRCGSPDLVPIAYGYPGGDMMAAAERGDIVLGGCMPGPASRRCRGCGTEV